MGTGTLEKKIAKLPDEMKKEVEQYVDTLLHKIEFMPLADEDDKFVNYRGYGSLKGKMWISEDFDAPLDDFADYM